VLPLRADPLANDLTQVYIAVSIARDHGWSHIYSLVLQQDLFERLRPHAVWNDGAWFTPAPPYAWLVFPLTLLGAAGAVYSWLAISLLSLVAAWWVAAPGQGRARVLWLLGALAWYPVLYGLSLVQPGLVMTAIAAVAWRLGESRRPFLAGAVLGLSVIKPQLVLVLPVVLLTAGRWRILRSPISRAASRMSSPGERVTSCRVITSPTRISAKSGRRDYRITWRRWRIRAKWRTTGTSRSPT